MRIVTASRSAGPATLTAHTATGHTAAVRTATVARCVLALAIALGLVVSVLLPAGFGGATPKANAQTAWQDSGAASVGYEDVDLKGFSLTATHSGTLNTVVLEDSKLTALRSPASDNAYLLVGGSRISNPGFGWDFSAKKWQLNVADVPVRAGQRVTIVAQYFAPLTNPRMTVSGAEDAPALTEITPQAPKLVEPGQCGVRKTVELPQVTGVRYERHDDTDTSTVTVTASPEAGYVLSAGATTRWEFNVAAQDCSAPDAGGQHPSFSVNGLGGLQLKDVSTTGAGTGPYSTKASTVRASTFSKAVIRLEKPGQAFDVKDFTFNLNGITAPAGTAQISSGKRVISNQLGYLEFEFYPMVNGSRVDSIELAQSAAFELISRFSFDPANAKISMDIYGTTEAAPAFPPADTVKLPQSDHQCGTVDGVPYFKKWWRTADSVGGATSGSSQNVSMLEVKLRNAASIDTNDPRFRVQFGNTGGSSGFMNLSNGLDFSTRVEGDSLFIIFNNPLQAPPHVYSDFHVFIPDAQGLTCDGTALTIWGVAKDQPDTGTPWRRDTGTLGAPSDSPLSPPATETSQAGYVYLPNTATQCTDGSTAVFTQWVHEVKDNSFNGDLSMISVDMGSNIGSVSDYRYLTVQVYPGMDLYRAPISIGSSSYTLQTQGNRLLIRFNSPIRDNGVQYRAVKINLTKRSTACGVGMVKLYRAAREIPQRCVADVTDPNGRPIPYMGNGQASTYRRPARELTEVEKAEGNRVYVTASKPDGQNRYSTQLYYQKQGAAQFVPIGKESGWVINSLAYNADDNWLYAISQPRIGQHKVIRNMDAQSNGYSYGADVVPLEDPCFPAGHLLQIDPMTGQVYNLGKVTKPGTQDYAFAGNYDQPWANDLWGGINNGFFDANGDYWVSNASLSGSGALYKVNLDHVTAAVRYGNPTDHSGQKSNYRVEDYTVLPQTVGGEDFSNGTYAWGIRNGWVSGGRVLLERVDLRTGQRKEIDITDLKSAAGLSVPTGLQWGKAWTYGNGDLGFGTASTVSTADGVRLRIINPDSANPTAELISVERNVPVSYNSNGTSNGTAPLKTDLQITKEFLGVDTSVQPARLRWRATVSNLGPDGSSGFVLTDMFPAGLKDVRVDANPSNVLVEINGDKTAFQAIFGPVKLNQSASLEFSAAVDEGTPARCVPNTATVLGNEEDPDHGNNSSTAECPPEDPDVKIQLQKVDHEDNAVLLDASFALFETSLGPDGQLQPTGEGTPIEVPQGGTSGATTVKSGQTYFLVETRSPAGYSLLPKPILLTVSRDADGKAQIEFQDQKNGFPASIVPTADKDVVTIQIADVTVGSLPKTGGMGVGWLALLGALIIAAGALVARRRA
ncbi:LPXTG cell wall anchor domain-containing protein [Corynebacterium sp.]|uniref:DUF6923 family protein n=1 Tax=Corynebacterium sp. TaxID=1720 RepID=UPI0026DD8227|nr:LPXTG cell wall anchor domain-containing protein [Corynebacterium sp.]MDO5032434.1 LPXTG cell wall anchor domain-containing protein [Corynebacterium sp.]